MERRIADVSTITSAIIVMQSHRSRSLQLPVPPAPVAGANETADIPELKTDEIARLAHSYWEARGCQGGSADEDWLRAEEELRARK